MSTKFKSGLALLVLGAVAATCNTVTSQPAGNGRVYRVGIAGGG